MATGLKKINLTTETQRHRGGRERQKTKTLKDTDKL